MAQVTITIPDEIIPRLREAMHYQHPQTVDMTDANGFKWATAQYWRQTLGNYELMVARRQAAAQVAADTAGIG